MKPNKTILGKTYVSAANANRAIRKFKVRYFVTIPKGFQFWVKKTSDGKFEVGGLKF